SEVNEFGAHTIDGSKLNSVAPPDGSCNDVRWQKRCGSSPICFSFDFQTVLTLHNPPGQRYQPRWSMPKVRVTHLLHYGCRCTLTSLSGMQKDERVAVRKRHSSAG